MFKSLCLFTAQSKPWGSIGTGGFNVPKDSVPVLWYNTVHSEYINVECTGVPAVPPAAGWQAEGGPVRGGQAQPVQAGQLSSFIN